MTIIDNMRHIYAIPNQQIYFIFALCTYVAAICLIPSASEPIGVFTLVVSVVIISNSSNIFQFLRDSSLISLAAFGSYCSVINAIGIGDVARTGIIYGWVIPLLVGKAFSRLRHKKIFNDMLIASIALALVMLFAQILLMFDIMHIENIDLDLQHLKLTFRNATRTAIFISVGCMICFTYFLLSQQKISRIIALTAGIILISALLVTEKRMTLASLILCCCLLFASKNNFRIIALGLTTIVCLIFLFGKTERFDLRPTHLLATQGERLTVWYAAREIIKTHPITGTGFRTFKEASAPHVEAYRSAHPAEAYENLEDAHNLPLHLLSETGFIGTAIFSLIFFFPLQNCWRLRNGHPAAIPLLSCISLIFLNSQLHVNVFSSNVAALLFFLTGTASGIGKDTK